METVAVNNLDISQRIIILQLKIHIFRSVEHKIDVECVCKTDIIKHAGGQSPQRRSPNCIIL